MRGLDRVAQQAVEHLAVGQPGQAVMRSEVFDPFVRPALLVGALEILQRERYVVGEPRQQLGEVRRERILFYRNANQNADEHVRVQFVALRLCGFN